MLAGGFVFYYFHIIKAYSVAKLIKAFFVVFFYSSLSNSSFRYSSFKQSISFSNNSPSTE